jgi:hypothetical protein
MTPAALRERLTEMRAELIAALARDGIDPGYLSLMAGIAATIDALDRMEAAPVDAGLRQTPSPPRGGDPKAACRSTRNEGVRALGDLLSADLSLEQRAHEIAGKVRRYRPGADDEHGGAERQALHQIRSAGLPVPGTRQLRRILAGEDPGRS